MRHGDRESIWSLQWRPSAPKEPVGATQNALIIKHSHSELFPFKCLFPPREKAAVLCWDRRASGQKAGPVFPEAWKASWKSLGRRKRLELTPEARFHLEESVEEAGLLGRRKHPWSGISGLTQWKLPRTTTTKRQDLISTANKTLKNSTVRVRRICQEERQLDWEPRCWAGCHSAFWTQSSHMSNGGVNLIALSGSWSPR